MDHLSSTGESPLLNADDTAPVSDKRGRDRSCCGLKGWGKMIDADTPLQLLFAIWGLGGTYFLSLGFSKCHTKTNGIRDKEQ
ncbi:hypothetical protein TNCV_4198031 [Trichonephila clavipes]|nr:hypothetical protein TNCV_4198031 [Trichonephila clavipes]